MEDPTGGPLRRHELDSDRLVQSRAPGDCGAPSPRPVLSGPVIVVVRRVPISVAATRRVTYACRTHSLTPEAPVVREPARVVYDAWDTYVAETDAGPAFVSFDAEAA